MVTVPVEVLICVGWFSVTLMMLGFCWVPGKQGYPGRVCNYSLKGVVGTGDNVLHIR